MAISNLTIPEKTASHFSPVSRVKNPPLLLTNTLHIKAPIVTGVKVSDLPGPEALFEPGRKDGQTKVRSPLKVLSSEN